MSGFLTRVVEQKRQEIETGRARESLSDLAVRCRYLPPTRGFRDALTAGPDRIIAEVKRRSPSTPRFARQEPPAELAALYYRAGAAALSLVTDRANFGSGPDDIAPMRAAAPLPLIAKDFVIDPWQVLALRAAGADAVLLIARLLDRSQLGELLNEAQSVGLDVLVECHDAADLDAALSVGADLVGINNRDLDGFTVSLDTSRALLPRVPSDCVAVVESGIAGRADVVELQDRGAAAFLVGTSLLQSDDPAALLRDLRGADRRRSEEAA
jgi:indole-3-glycerol phosphate synthase